MARKDDVLDRSWQGAREELVSAARNTGIEPGILVKIAGFESGFNPQARPVSRNQAANAVRQFDGVMAISSAHGYGQFIDGTWAAMVQQYGERYGVEGASRMTRAQANSSELRNDSRLQAALLAEFTRENIAKGARLGGPDPDANVYAFHNLGDRDASAFLNAMRSSPEARVDSVLPARVIRGNPALYGDGSRTLSDAYAVMGRHMDRYERYALDSIGIGGLAADVGGMSADRMGAGAQRGPLLAHGHTGEHVRDIQDALGRLGYPGLGHRPLKADGDFGQSTEHAVRSFQRAHGLHADGIVGEDTRRALARAERTPLVSERTHPDHPVFQEARNGLRQLPAGTFRNDLELDNAAAAMTAKARQAGMAHIDHVVPNTRGDSFIAVQGGLQDPARQMVSVEKQVALTQSIERSTAQMSESAMAQQQAAQASTQMQHMEHRNGFAVGMRP